MFFAELIGYLIVLVPLLLLCVRQYNISQMDKEIRNRQKSLEEETDSLIQKTVGGTCEDQFFIECVLSGCDDFTQEKNVLKAKMLADKYNVSYSDSGRSGSLAAQYIKYADGHNSSGHNSSDSRGIEAAFNRAMQEHLRITAKTNIEKLAQKREAEKKQFEALNRYSNCYGKDKKATILLDRMKELRRAASTASDGAKVFIQSTQQRERDWAVWGGFASGIAGTGAGIATALDIQNQNAQIRAQNKANLDAAWPAYMSITENAHQMKARADQIEKEINLLKEKLISPMNSNEVMSLLDIINPTVEVSETGAFKVTATVKAKETLYIYDDVPAVADGTIIAHVWDGEKEIGTAKMVLPVNGVSSKTGLVGVGLSGAERGKNYTATFTPYMLWMMEE